MLTDKGDDGDAEKSDELEAINCLTRLRKDNFETRQRDHNGECFVHQIPLKVNNVDW